MTAKTNVNAAVTAAAAVEVNDTHKSRLTLEASGPIETSQSMQHGTSKPQHQAPLTGKEINNDDREEICSRKRNLEALNNDDVESTASHQDEDNGSDSDDSRGRKPGRRPMTEEECDVDDDEDPKAKRKIQNRAAQRAFRERKERYVKELEKKIKYVQDSHVYSTTRLFNENQQLRSIIYTLELEVNALKGAPIDFMANADFPLMEKKNPSQSWLANIGPSIPLPVINSFPPTPLAPLRIHPSIPSTYQESNSKLKTCATSIPDAKKQTKPVEQQKPVALTSFVNDSSKQVVPKPSKITKPNTAPTTKRMKKSDTNQRFTFAITTPATLRAVSNNDLARKNTQIEAVQLYPGHSLPGNCMFDNNKQRDHMSNATRSTHSTIITPALSPHYTASVASSCSGNSCSSSPSGEEAGDTMEHTPPPPAAEDMCDDLLLFDHIDDEIEDVGLNDILKQFFDPTSNVDLSVFNTQAPNDWEAQPYQI